MKRKKVVGRTGSKPGRRGFTLAELIVAGVIVALLAAATAGVVSTLVRSQRSAGARREAFARADAVASRAALDLQQIVRDSELSETRVLITDGGASGNANDEMMLRVKSARPMRSPEFGAESGEYLVHYRVQPGGGGMEAWRRINHARSVVEQGGGIASRLAEGIELVGIEAYDGAEWKTAWDADTSGLPYGVRVTVRAHAADGKTTATVRRVVAVDRVPVPKAEETTSGTNGSGNSTGSSSTGGT
jgi:type II secretion system protein J